MTRISIYLTVIHASACTHTFFRVVFNLSVAQLVKIYTLDEEFEV